MSAVLCLAHVHKREKSARGEASSRASFCLQCMEVLFCKGKRQRKGEYVQMWQLQRNSRACENGNPAVRFSLEIWAGYRTGRDLMMKWKAIKWICSVWLMIALLCFQAFSAYASEQLVISSGIADYIAIPLFEADHPGISVKIEPVSPLYSELENKFITKDNQVDVYRLNANLGIFRQLRAKGYFFDLSSDAVIKGFTERLHKTFREQVFSGYGKILGVPSFFILEYPILVNRDVAEAIGLAEKDFPASVLDLLKFVNAWEESYGEAFPQYAPFRADEASSYALAHRNPYIGLVLEMYKDTFAAQGQPLRYDTPLFLALLGEIERWTYANDQDYAAKTNALPDYDHCLFYSFQAFDDEILKWVCKNERYIPLPLTTESPTVQAYELECVVVNPATSTPEWAVELARCYVEDCQPALLRLLCTDQNAPYQSPDYQKMWRSFSAGGRKKRKSSKPSILQSGKNKKNCSRSSTL